MSYTTSLACNEPRSTIILCPDCMCAGYMDPANSGVSFLSVISSDHSDSRQRSRPQFPYQPDTAHHEEVGLPWP